MKFLPNTRHEWYTFCVTSEFGMGIILTWAKLPFGAMVCFAVGLSLLFWEMIDPADW